MAPSLNQNPASHTHSNEVVPESAGIFPFDSPASLTLPNAKALAAPQTGPHLAPNRESSRHGGGTIAAVSGSGRLERMDAVMARRYTDTRPPAHAGQQGKTRRRTRTARGKEGEGIA